MSDKIESIAESAHRACLILLLIRLVNPNGSLICECLVGISCVLLSVVDAKVHEMTGARPLEA